MFKYFVNILIVAPAILNAQPDTLEQKIQPLLSIAIQQSRQKNSNLDSTDTGKKDSYRIRIRNAAGFISRLIDAAIDDSDAEEEEVFETISKANHPVFF